MIFANIFKEGNASNMFIRPQRTLFKRKFPKGTFNLSLMRLCDWSNRPVYSRRHDYITM